MRIAIDGSRAFIKDKTGTENYSYQIIKNLAKVDSENHYLIYLRPGIKISDGSGKWPKNFQFKVINYQRLWTQAGLAKETFKDQVDVLFVPAHTLPIIRRPGLKTVVTVHDLGSEYLPKAHQLKQRLYLSLMQKVQLKGATHLIAVSKATKDDLIKKIGINPKKISVVYEGFDKELFNPIRNLPAGRQGNIVVNTLKQYDLEAGKYFLFVGTVQPRKNLERLITAFAKVVEIGPVGSQPHSTSSLSLWALNGVPRSPSPISSLRLVIVGKKGWLSDQIYALPKKLGIEKQVKFLDFVPEKELPALYRGAAALTFPSLFEGFGLPIIEAQACGCPVLTSNLSSMLEVAGKGAVLVDPYSVNDIVKGMDRVQDTKIRVEMIKRGFENVKRFSWEKAAKETLKVLESI